MQKFTNITLKKSQITQIVIIYNSNRAQDNLHGAIKSLREHMICSQQANAWCAGKKIKDHSRYEQQRICTVVQYQRVESMHNCITVD